MAKSHSRGHEIEYVNQEWIYSDTGESCNNTRPCKRCGRPPTPEGYDACLGLIEGATSACCGHGIEEAYCVGRKVV